MPTARPGVCRLVLLIGLLACLAAGLAGCGDEPDHGLETERFESAPTGDAILPGFAVTDGESYRSDVRMAMDVRYTKTLDGRPDTKEHRGQAVLALVWTMRKPVDDAAATSALTLRYTQAEGDNAEDFLARDAIRGSLSHAADGRVEPRSLQLEGGSTQEQLEAQTLLVNLLLAGFAGSYPWLPPRGVRVGESWALEGFIRPRALDNVRRYGRETGLATPEPTFEGTGVLRAIVEEDGERWFDVEIDALVQLSGTVRKGTERAKVSMGERVTGSARISVARGVPKQFDVVHTRRQQSDAGLAKSDLHVKTTLRGSVVHTPPGT